METRWPNTDFAGFTAGWRHADGTNARSNEQVRFGSTKFGKEA